MKIHDKILLVALFTGVILVSCSKTPKGIIRPDDMAELMADTYMLEGLIDMNVRQYNSDSTRLFLKRSLYARRGYDQTQVDTSLAWYGRNIEVYVEVCDKAIEILEQRQQELALANNRSVSVAGDSVNIWPGANHLTVGLNTSPRFITFDIPADSNWRKGDIYELRYKLINAHRGLKSKILVDYSDGMTDYNETMGQNQGTTKLKLRIDSTNTPTRIYGYLDLGEFGNDSFHVDSIALIRTRKGSANNTYISTRHFRWGETKTKKDTVQMSATMTNTTSHQMSDDMPLPPGIIQ